MGKGILSEVDMGIHKLEVDLLLRDALSINSMLFTTEAWSGITEKQLTRMEVVDTSLLQKLTGGHSHRVLSLRDSDMEALTPSAQLFQRFRTVEQIYTFKLVFNTLLTLAHPWFFGCSQD